jgi:hypothetical protein
VSGTQHVPSRDRPRLRAPHRRGARVAVAVAAVGVLAVPIARDAAASGAVEAPNNVSAEPFVVIDGGSAEQRQTVLNAVDRYLSVGLALPDLRFRFHTGGKAGCGGFQGLFHPEGDIAVIDLCFPGQFLALHELGHAWERFNLDDHRRAEFERLTGLTTWRSTDVVWRERGAERAANVLAHGLLSTPLDTARYHIQVFAEFEALTGITTPRLAEIEPPDTTVEPPNHEQLTRLATYEEWRHTSARA